MSAAEAVAKAAVYENATIAAEATENAAAEAEAKVNDVLGFLPSVIARRKGCMYALDGRPWAICFTPPASSPGNA